MARSTRKTKSLAEPRTGIHRLLETMPTAEPAAGQPIAALSGDVKVVGIGERVEQLIGLYKTQREAAKFIGRTPETLANWASGTVPPFEPLARLAIEKKVSLQWLATGDGPMFSAEPAPADFVYIPRYELRAGAGNGQIIESENIKEFIAFRAEWVRARLRRNPAHLAVLEAFGDSMAPTIKDGDIMLVDTSEDRVRGNAIYVVRAGDEALVKRVELKLDGTLLVKSDNPSYETVALRADQIPDLRVLGKVVWTGGLV